MLHMNIMTNTTTMNSTSFTMKTLEFKEVITYLN